MTARSGNASTLRCPDCDNMPPRGTSKYGSGSSDAFSMNSDEDHNNLRFRSSQLHGDNLGYRQSRVNNSPNKKHNCLAVDKMRDAEPRIGSSTGFRRSGQVQEWETLERTTEMEAFQRPTRYNVHDRQSNCHSDPNYIDTAEILRKIDELKDQLNHSFDAADRVKDQMTFKQRQVPYSNGASVSSGDSKQFFVPYKYDNSKRPFIDHPKSDADHTCFSGQHQRREVYDPTSRSTLQQQRFLNRQGSPSYFHESPAQVGPHVPNFRDHDNSKVVDAHPQRRSVTARRYCHPILGASPFILCIKCFGLLQLPKRVRVASNNQQKIHCGACSTTLTYSLVEKKLAFSIVKETNEVVPNSAPSHRHINQESITNFSSFDGFDHSSPRLSVASGEIDRLSNVSAPQPRELFHYYRRRQPDKGSHIPSPDNEKMIDNKVTLRSEFPSGVDIPSSEFSNIQDSLNRSREDDKANHKRGEVNRITGTSSDFSISSHEDEEDDGGIVTVNGHAIPDCLVRNAEKMAGRIRPGDYWYDFRAGFWGTMDSPCLGIVPPLIGEFKYRIPRKCSGGNTGVIVNGRELHQKDLEMLSSRGLPTQRGKSYVVEISGTVLDEETGEELQPLGRLAPTVEKMKQGFGMRVPRRPVGQA